MMRKIYFVIISLFISILTFSQTSDDDVYYDGWEYLGKSQQGDKIYIKDIEKKSYGENYTFWIKYIDAPTKYKNKQGKWMTKKNGYSIQYTTINCESKNCDISEYLRYNSKGDLIDSGNLYIRNEKIAPDTIIEGVYDYICR